MEIKDSLEKLFSLQNMGIKLGLENISRFLEHLGNPQRKLKCIHIAGSNGKGSTASFISSILQEYGYKVGLYSSPHFVKFNERIRINGLEIPDEYIKEFISNHFDYIMKNHITFFEATTALAFLYYKEKKVDYAVVETGLGGRLDATNVISPLCSVITSISLEHTKILGETLAEIAEEKAGIIKKGKNVLIGKVPEEAKYVISQKCNLLESPLFTIDKYLIKTEMESSVIYKGNCVKISSLPLYGDYQKINAALAIVTVMQVKNEFNNNIYELGLKNVIQNTGLEGRYEYYNSNPDIIFDSAHNPDGVKNFLTEFKKNTKKYKNKFLLFSALDDKAYRIMLKDLREEFDEIFITQINYKRAAKVEEIEKVCKEYSFKVGIINNCKDLINKIKLEDRDNCLVVLGSMFLLGEIKNVLLNPK